MTTTVTGDWGGVREHLVVSTVAALHAELDQVSDTELWTLSRDEAAQLLADLTRLSARVAELELRAAMAADRGQVKVGNGAPSTKDWWATHTRQTRAETARKFAMAKALDYHHEPVRDALAAGDLLVEQAQVIVRAVDALRTGAAKDLVDAEIVALAERELIRLAATHDAKALVILGRRILDVVAPEVAEAHEARLLEQEERNARAATKFFLRDKPDGTAVGRFTIPSAIAELLRKQLLALLSPQGKTEPLATTDEDGEPLTGAQRMGAAFVEYIRRYPVDRLPTAGGMSTRLTITIDFDQLLSRLGSASLDTGGVISAAQARMLACEAGILPMVMGGPSQVLDLGREQRLADERQRAVLVVTQGGCTAEGCDWPPGMSHVHHDDAWATGGRTDINNLRLLCPGHHSRAHDPAYRTTRLPNNKMRFTRRT